MSDRPILFSPDMICAILAGRKTQTRRIIQSGGSTPEFCGGRYDDKNDPTCWGWENHEMGEWVTLDQWKRFTFVRFRPGDRLYAREAWKSDRYYDDLSPSQMSGEEPLIYLADDTVQRWGWKPDALSRWGRFRQGMHMPKWASRITLHVSEVRVERVQDISAIDSLREGVMCATCRTQPSPTACFDKGCFASLKEFSTLWDSLNTHPRPVKGRDGKVSHYESFPWAGEPRVEVHRGLPHHIFPNPWVTATTFEPEFCNISEARG